MRSSSVSFYHAFLFASLQLTLFSKLIYFFTIFGTCTQSVQYNEHFYEDPEDVVAGGACDALSFRSKSSVIYTDKIGCALARWAQRKLFTFHTSGVNLPSRYATDNS